MVDGRKDTALGLGERLRSARKARALSLQQAAFTLRLEESVLRALEDERYEVLGAAVFVRGHLKAYAKLLGLSEEAVLAAYKEADPNADSPPKVTREREKPLTTTPGPLAIVAAVALAVVAMFLLYVLGTGDERAAPTSAALPASLPAIEVVPAPAPAPKPTPEPSPESGPEAAARPTPLTGQDPPVPEAAAESTQPATSEPVAEPGAPSPAGTPE